MEPVATMPAVENVRTTGVEVLHGNSVDLATRLAEWLGGQLSDPFAREVVSVPTPGVERWLTQQFAGHFGVCAAVDFIGLDRLVQDVLAAAAGVGQEDPWQPGSLTWSVLDVLDDAAASSPVLANYISSEFTRRSVVAGQIAQHLHSYTQERPELVTAWARGEDVDDQGHQLAEEDRWQAEIWRLLVDRIDVPDPVTRLAGLPETLTNSPNLLPLPGRLAVFGPTRLNRTQLSVLDALGGQRAVSLWLPHPSPKLWQRLDSAAVTPGSLRSHLPEAARPTNVLTERLGREASELQIAVTARNWPATAVSTSAPSGDSTLHRLQAAVHQDELLQPAAIAEDDESIRFHQCHGPDRQVEVLREVVLGLLADDPSLEPRDIIVQCPAIDAYAPLLHATFGLTLSEAAHPGQELPVRLADRSLREINPVLQVLAAVLELAVGRATRSELLDLCAAEPVARKFGWNREQHLDSLVELLDEAGINWGVDAAFRARYKVGFGQNTWASATDRLLLGILRDEDDEHFAGTAVPVGRVESSDTELIGRFAEFTHRVGALIHELGSPAALPVWVERCHRLIDELTAVAPADGWQLGHAHGALADLFDVAGDTTSPLQVGDLVALLSDAFSGRPTRTNFATGALTICTLMPMRTVPHRVVILLGLDDGVFPRRPVIDGDDLIARAPRLGDADARAADRQALLDSVMSAGEKLVLIYSGFDERTNQQIEPAPPVQDIMDACEDLGRCPKKMSRSHPLQPYGERDFSAPPFSFDPHALAAARAARADPVPRPAVFAADRLPAPERPEGLIHVELADLEDFFKHPVKALLKRRGGIVLRDEEPPPEQLPMELDGLGKWQIKNRLLTGLLHGAEDKHLLNVERRRGQLPPGEYGSTVLNRCLSDVLPIAELAQKYQHGTPRSINGSAEVGRYLVSGNIRGVYGNRIVTVTPSRLDGQRRFTAWLQVLVATVIFPGEWEAVTIGGRGNALVVGPLSQSSAAGTLNHLIQVFRDGLTQPVLWPVKCAAELVDTKEVSEQTKKFAFDTSWEQFIPWDKFAKGQQFEQLSRDLFAPLLQSEKAARR